MDKLSLVIEKYLEELLARIERGDLKEMKSSQLVWVITKLTSTRRTGNNVQIVNVDMGRVESLRKRLLVNPEGSEEIRDNAIKQVLEERTG